MSDNLHPSYTLSPHARQFDATGDHISAIVLNQLIYWWKKGTRFVHGVEWRAKPRDQLAVECRVSNKQLRSALENLKKRAIIETSQHRFGYGGKAIMHYRLLPYGLGLTEPRKRGKSEPEIEADPCNSVAQNEADPKGLEGQPAMALQGQPLFLKKPIEYQNITSTSLSIPNKLGIPSLVSEHAFANPAGGCFKKADFGTEQKQKEVDKSLSPSRKKNPSPKAPLLKLGKLQATKKLPNLISVKKLKLNQPLARAWSQAFAATYTGCTAVPFTAKDFGQLKMLSGKLPDGWAEPVVRHVIANWAVFVTRVTTESGAFQLSARPEVGLVLKFLGVAANLWREETAGKKPASGKFGNQIVPESAVPKPAPQPVHVTATPKEVMAVFPKYG